MKTADAYVGEDPAGMAGSRAGLWWKDTPVLHGERIGTIGDFSARDGAEAKQLLDEACDLLREQGCRTAVGPMNGNTWAAHRFVIESDGRAPFLLEPQNPPGHPGWWEGAGFSVLSRYSSSAMPLDGIDAIPPAVMQRLLRSGVMVRTLDPVRYDEELRTIHALSLKCFAGNFLYTPLPEEAFLGAYRKIRERVDADLVRIAERDGVACGFIFGLPDERAVIVKTLAVDPEARCAGLGSLLVDGLHRSGLEKGFSEAIHALQHETNTSLKITGRHHGKVFRSYALFAKPL